MTRLERERGYLTFGIVDVLLFDLRVSRPRAPVNRRNAIDQGTAIADETLSIRDGTGILFAPQIRTRKQARAGRS